MAQTVIALRGCREHQREGRGTKRSSVAALEPGTDAQVLPIADLVDEQPRERPQAQRVQTGECPDEGTVARIRDAAFESRRIGRIGKAKG